MGIVLALALLLRFLFDMTIYYCVEQLGRLAGGGVP